MSIDIETYYAPAKRAEVNELLRQKSVFDRLPQLSFFLDTVPTIYLILNEDRQIIFANKTALKAFNYNNIDELLGKRVGEAIFCEHSNELAGGCGTSEACQHCGAAQAIMSGLNQRNDMKECRITTESGINSYDFRVWTSPYNVDGEKYVIFSLNDISDEKRRRALERIFFHDVMNTAGGIKGISSLISQYPEEIEEFKDVLYSSSNQLLNELQAQRDLASAENNELKIQPVDLTTKSILKYVSDIYSNHTVARDKFLKIDDACEEIFFTSDEATLVRVIGNMTKNALEASSFNQTVTLTASGIGNGKVRFSVHNPNYMPRNIQLQVFQRSFSTKGANRGLGTYSMKLLSEKYLNGRVYFETDEDNGTTFHAEYPISLITDSE